MEPPPWLSRIAVSNCCHGATIIWNPTRKTNWTQIVSTCAHRQQSRDWRNNASGELLQTARQTLHFHHFLSSFLADIVKGLGQLYEEEYVEATQLGVMP